ncbi:MAG: lipoyl synthase [Deltaproteobacteria bacterium]|jgi:lipoic acid synthetase|uniref:Lipoyl synthase n=1 Tax=Candidatus Acidulodesulfobacterium acidiphilum TaxID=2597224 RepID=A0A520XBW9_9DELT|nr:lipoyl synthase [Deltaproteobacteria bacterium]MDA8299551.1 lipoyl synthase [Deltaproteobacteria bacterium]RZV38628.1 MAG: lipoyl synthase [Candidatus Acidulodesulfobacterium acidiphilum]
MNERLPDYLKKEILKIKSRKDIFETSKIIKEKELNTVCSSSRCPNLHLCFSNKTATFLLLGNKCTRKCPFCNIEHMDIETRYTEPASHALSSATAAVDTLEPQKVAYAVKTLELKHAVITMVTRDDLYDGGADILIKTIKEIRKTSDCKVVEVLTSDFNGNIKSALDVAESGVDIFGHNMETVERLYADIRPSSSYKRSLNLLKTVKQEKPDIVTKSGIMVGLGEDDGEVFQTIDDMIDNGVEFITIGQYLRPSLENIPVQRYIPLNKFIEYKNYANKKGVKQVFAAPLVRSSFGAEKFFKHSY